MTEVPEAALSAALSEHGRLLSDRPDPMVLPDEVLLRRVLEAAMPHLEREEVAAEAVTAHNAMLDLQWLLGAGLDVQVTPCGGAGRCCGDTGGRFSVRAAKPDPVAALPLPGGVESHGHASPGEALAFARDWCEQNGITP